MGDRANIVIEKDNQMFPAPVFFYTHSGGYKIKQTLQDGLKRGRPRWNDSQYLSRIIFCEMVKGNEMAETGFGISTAVGDGSYNLLCVNIEENKVRERGSHEDENAGVVQEWTFEEFVAADFEDRE